MPRKNRKEENLIRWEVWDKASFERARKERKPVLLYLYAKWCSSCRTVENFLFNDTEIANKIIQNYVPIKVDADVRPDINDRYNFGFPTFALLTDSGYVVAYSNSTNYNEIKDMLESFLTIYKGLENELSNIHNEDMNSEKIADMMLAPPVAWENSMNDMVELDVAGMLAKTFDEKNGGFGQEPKFPLPEAIDFLIYQYNKRSQEEHIKMVVKTLEGIMEGLYDKIDGGFFRYSVTADWRSPKFEKLLNENAKLISNYIHAYEITKDNRFWAIAEGAIGYVLKHLYDEKSMRFYGSQAADETYYRLGKEHRVLNHAPEIDFNSYTSASALFCCTLLHASYVFENENYRTIALQALKNMLDNVFDENIGVYHLFDGKNKEVAGLLTDNAYFAYALLDAYEVTGNRIWRDAAVSILNFVDVTLKRKGDGYIDCPITRDSIGRLRIRRTPLLENSLVAYAHSRLGYHLNSENHISNAKEVLSTFITKYLDFGIFSPMYAQACAIIAEPILITISGKNDDEKCKKFIEESMRTFEPRKVVKRKEKEDDANVLITKIAKNSETNFGPFFEIEDFRNALNEVRKNFKNSF
ncbi:MAG: DUF255 domain-containing protein [Thermoplasmata archaeon]